MSHVSVAHFPQCYMSNLRKEYVPCHYIFLNHIACHYALCQMSNLRKAQANRSILGSRAAEPLNCLADDDKEKDQATRFRSTTTLSDLVGTVPIFACPESGQGLSRF